MDGLCRHAGCHDATVGGHRATPNDLCRTHYNEWARASGELVRCEVLTPTPITGLNGEGVGKGGVVEVHPGEVRVPALVKAGLVKVLGPAEPAVPAVPAEAEIPPKPAAKAKAAEPKA